MNLSYNRIRHFLTIVKYMNLSKAAQELFISQPALSLSLSKIEEELGVSLFYRTGNKLVLSNEGEALLPRFQEIQNSYDALTEDINKLRHTDDEYITVGIAGSALLFSTFYMTGFLNSFNGKVVKKFFADRKQITSMLIGEQLDFVIAYPPLTDPRISNITLMNEHINLAVSSNHLLANRESIRLSDLTNIKMIGLTRHHHFRKLCDNICLEHNITIHYRYEVEYPEYHELIHNSAFSSSFAAFCASDTFAGTFGEGFKLIPIEDENMCRTTALAFLEKSKVQYKYADLIEHIKDGFYKQHLYHAFFSSALKEIHINHFDQH